MTDLTRSELFEALSSTQAELEAAQHDLDRAIETVREARKKEADCMNRVNDLQKEFNSIVTDIRKAAPEGTDWRLKKDMTYAPLID